MSAQFDSHEALGHPGRISRAGPRWRISGRKLYTTGIPALRWLAVWRRTDEATPRVGFFLVPRPGRIAPASASWKAGTIFALRASCSHDVILEDVEIPLDYAVDLRLPAAWSPAEASRTEAEGIIDQQARTAVMLSTLYDAVAQAARNWLVGFLNERAPASLGAPLATLPRVQETVGAIEALLNANRVILDDAAGAADGGTPPSITRSRLLKFTVTGNAIEAVDLALKLTGNHGLSRHNPLERYHRDVLCGRIHTPQDDTILTAAGRDALTTGAPS